MQSVTEPFIAFTSKYHSVISKMADVWNMVQQILSFSLSFLHVFICILINTCTEWLLSALCSHFYLWQSFCCSSYLLIFVTCGPLCSGNLKNGNHGYQLPQYLNLLIICQSTSRPDLMLVLLTVSEQSEICCPTKANQFCCN